VDSAVVVAAAISMVGEAAEGQAVGASNNALTLRS
jgi:hypothetical protein